MVKPSSTCDGSKCMRYVCTRRCGGSTSTTSPSTMTSGMSGTYCFISSDAKHSYFPPGRQVVLGRRRGSRSGRSTPGRGDRLPDRLRGGLDVDAEDLVVGSRCRSVVLMLMSPVACLRSVSADTRRSVYLSIHRSWMSRMGTGLRKCNFSRPASDVTTRPASSRTRRCFMTPKRVMSIPDSSSVSVRPSRSKSRSRSSRRVGSASALNTSSSSASSSLTKITIGDQIVTCQEWARRGGGVLIGSGRAGDP